MANELSDFHGCIVRAVVTNESNQVVKIVAMAEGFWGSWRTDPSDEFVIPGWACRANFPYVHRLASGESVAFQFPIIATKKGVPLSGKTLRVGFLNVKVSEHFSDEEDAALNGRPPPGTPILWSNSFVIPKESLEPVPRKGVWEIIQTTDALLK